MMVMIIAMTPSLNASSRPLPIISLSTSCLDPGRRLRLQRRRNILDQGLGQIRQAHAGQAVAPGPIRGPHCPRNGTRLLVSHVGGAARIIFADLRADET